MKTKTINKIITRKFDAWLRSITDETVVDLVEKNTIMTGGAIASMLLNEDVNDYDFYFRNKETALALANYYVNMFVKNKEAMNNQSLLTNLPVSPTSPTSVDVPISVKEFGDRIKIVVKSSGIAAMKDENDYRYFELDAVPQADSGGQYIESLVDISNQLKNNDGKKFLPIFLSSNAITLTDQVQIVIRFYGEPATIHENYDFAHCRNYWTSWGNEVVLDPKALECLLTKELVYVGSKRSSCFN